MPRSPGWPAPLDPIRRRRWYTDDELAAVQVVKSGDVYGSYWVIAAGELLGTVRPHLPARGTPFRDPVVSRSGTCRW
ncbi:hypothetical protein [Planotetraspora sp. GP83]|uniref:hypothetical protein n=1 Tax=Planotetraspora sp. GP83 TaxID=3156264 RepID=UPI0035184B7D